MDKLEIPMIDISHMGNSCINRWNKQFEKIQEEVKEVENELNKTVKVSELLIEETLDIIQSAFTLLLDIDDRELNLKHYIRKHNDKLQARYDAGEITIVKTIKL